MAPHGSAQAHSTVIDSYEPDLSTLSASQAHVHRAKLGGIPGAALLRSRRLEAKTREWRGTFVFHSDYEPAVAALPESPTRVVFEGWIDGSHRKLNVVLTAVALGAGLALFEAAGEPY